MERMTNFDIQKLLKFFGIAGKLKGIARSGWVEAGLPKPESVADHTFRTVFLCMLYSDLEGLDSPHLLRMALIHDLPEAIIGDLTPTKRTLQSRKKENEVMRQMLSLLPEEQRKKYMNAWKEYQDGKTREAKVVRQIEKLEMALQAKEYGEAGTKWQNLERFIKSADEAITWPELRRLLVQILEEKPQ